MAPARRPDTGAHGMTCAAKTIFKIVTSDGHIFRIFDTGEIEGFPLGCWVVNNIPAFTRDHFPPEPSNNIMGSA